MTELRYECPVCTRKSNNRYCNCPGSRRHASPGISQEDRKLLDRLRVTKSSGDTPERDVDIEKKLRAYR